ncbi:hypothetical protein GCM10009584_03000 [Ornithinimicrobium humiphilum]|uniref:Uncharacterized protein n=1 Tax=Ornithinimicrobium humiphilum TaxID=125288 RepID=A0A543K7H8_9MICO|nr:hypothetical protein [Ornithinimicrobium humiphilum]TQM91036.1 hypothetical protein FB476_2754 [Ornithinimicrobium humiphilum]
MSPSSRLLPRLAPSAYVTGSVVAVVVVLGVAAFTAPGLLAFALAAGAAVLAWGWAGALALPSPRGSLTVIVVGGLALVLSVAFRTGEPWLVWVPAALAISMIAAFAHQLFRVDGRPRLVQSVSSVVLALTLIASGVLLVPPSHTRVGVWLIVGALAAAAASAATDLLGRRPALQPWLTAFAMAAGGLASVVVALLSGNVWTTWLLVGVAAGALSHAMRTVMAPLPTLALARPRLVAALASVLVVGAVPYLVARAFEPGALLG